jgi:hypothetical protein
MDAPYNLGEPTAVGIMQHSVEESVGRHPTELYGILRCATSTIVTESTKSQIHQSRFLRREIQCGFLPLRGLR